MSSTFYRVSRRLHMPTQFFFLYLLCIASSASVPLRYTNCVTCCNISPPSFICMFSCCFPTVIVLSFLCLSSFPFFCCFHLLHLLIVGNSPRSPLSNLYRSQIEDCSVSLH